jgi:hypothetical protein
LFSKRHHGKVPGWPSYFSAWNEQRQLRAYVYIITGEKHNSGRGFNVNANFGAGFPLTAAYIRLPFLGPVLLSANPSCEAAPKWETGAAKVVPRE